MKRCEESLGLAPSGHTRLDTAGTFWASTLGGTARSLTGTSVQTFSSNPCTLQTIVRRSTAREGLKLFDEGHGAGSTSSHLKVGSTYYVEISFVDSDCFSDLGRHH